MNIEIWSALGENMGKIFAQLQGCIDNEQDFV